MILCDPVILCRVQCAAHRRTRSDTVPQLLPTALPPCSWCHYSHTERSMSLKILLREAGGMEKNKREQKGNELMRAAASFSNNRRENGVKRTQNHLSKWTIFYFCDRWLYKEHLRVYLWHMRTNFLQHVWLNVYACVQTAMFDDVSFTTGSLCFHRSLWAGRIFPAALWKVTVWMTDGRAAKMKHIFPVNFPNIYSFEECFYLVSKWNLRKNGVVEYSRQSIVNMVDHMIEVFTWLKPQGVTGLIGVNDDLHRQKNCMKDLISTE